MDEKPKILVVDDEILTLQFVKLALNQLNCSVITAQSGAEALIMLKQAHDIDVLLLDIMMPGIDGLQIEERNVHRVSLICVNFLSHVLAIL